MKAESSPTVVLGIRSSWGGRGWFGSLTTVLVGRRSQSQDSGAAGEVRTESSQPPVPQSSVDVPCTQCHTPTSTLSLSLCLSLCLCLPLCRLPSLSMTKASGWTSSPGKRSCALCSSEFTCRAPSKGLGPSSQNLHVCRECGLCIIAS